MVVRNVGGVGVEEVEEKLRERYSNVQFFCDLNTGRRLLNEGFP